MPSLRSTEDEKAFLVDQTPLLRERVNIILLMGCILMPVFGLVDYFLYPEYLEKFFIYRTIASVLCLALYLFSRYRDIGYYSFYLGALAYYIVGLAIIKMIVDTGGFGTPYYAGLILVFLGFSVVLTGEFRLFAVHTMVLYSIYILTVVFTDSPDHVFLFIGNNMFMFGTLMIVLIAARANYNLRFKEYKTRVDLKNAQAQLEQYSESLENSVVESETKYRLVVENANEAILIYREDRPLFFNKKALEVFGYPRARFSATPVLEVIHPEDRIKWLEQHRARLRGVAVPQMTEFRTIDASGDIRWVQASSVLVDWEGRPATLALMNDITDRVVAQGEVSKLEEQLLQSQKMEAVGTLASGIAHDFNNLIQAVGGYVQVMMAKGNADKANQAYLVEVDRTLQRAGELIRSLLTFSRKVTTELRPVDLTSEVSGSVSMLKRTIPKMINIETRLATNLKLIAGDSNQLSQVLMNLATNARDSMPGGGTLTIKTANVVLDADYCSKHLDMQPGEYVLLRVSDTGFGMDKKTQTHIFEPFFTTKGVGDGTGLGLSTVYGIVSSHEGHLVCDSDPGVGTAMSIYFPVLEAERTEAQAESDDWAADFSGGDESIMLVDDEEAILKAGREILKLYGYSITTATSGEDALDAYRKQGADIDLVILDLGMPGMGGQTCLKELRKLDPEVKVIVASGYSASEHGREAIAAGAKCFICKPYRLDNMIETVRGVLDGNPPTSTIN